MVFFSSAFLSVSKERETVELEKKKNNLKISLAQNTLHYMAADVVLVI
jgi:hypothetical protein